MRRLARWWIAALVLMAPASYADVVDRIVAVVNDEIITLSDLNAAFEPYRKQIQDTYTGEGREGIIADARMSFLNRLVDNILIDQEAKKNRISVKDEEVMATIDGILRQKNITMEDFIKLFASQGITFASYKKDITMQMIKMRLLRQEIKSKVMVTDDEVGEYYRNHRADYEGKEAVRIKQIFLAFPKGADEKAKEKVRREGEDIVRRLKEGESFDQLVVRHSQGPTAAGGDIGFIERGVVFPEVEQAAFRMKKGEFSDAIPSPAGVHIIQVIDKRGTGAMPIETVREEIRAKIEDQKMEKKFDEWLSQLRKKSHIDIRL